MLRADTGPEASRELRGARAVAARVSDFASMAPHGHPAWINGSAGIVVVPPGAGVTAVLAFTVRVGRIAAIDIVADPDRLRGLDPTAFTRDVDR